MFRALCLALFVVNSVALELFQREYGRMPKHAPSGEKRLLPQTAHELKAYTLEKFVEDFGRTYKKDTEEWKNRAVTFKKNLQELTKLHKHNVSRTWTPGITKFMDYSEAEYTMLLGYKGRRSPRHLSTVAIGRNSSEEPAQKEDKPKKRKTSSVSFSHAKGPGRKLTSFVRDQGMCGSCWAAAAVAVLEGVVEAKYGDMMTTLNAKAKAMKTPMTTLSTQAMVSCTPNPKNCGGTGGCDGATAELAYDMVKEKGMPLAAEWLYTSGSDGKNGKCGEEHFGSEILVYVSGYTVLPINKYAPLIEAVSEKGHPIAVAVDATNWNFYSGGIYSDTDNRGKGDFTINHEVTLVGYKLPGDRTNGYYLIKNSWGPTFGEEGFIRIEMKKDEEKHCGWDRDTHIGLACDGDPDKAWVCGTCGILYDMVFPTGLSFKTKGNATPAGN